jgi:hypothetical protein
MPAAHYTVPQYLDHYHDDFHDQHDDGAVDHDHHHLHDHNNDGLRVAQPSIPRTDPLAARLGTAFEPPDAIACPFAGPVDVGTQVVAVDAFTAPLRCLRAFAMQPDA